MSGNGRHSNLMLFAQRTVPATELGAKPTRHISGGRAPFSLEKVSIYAADSPNGSSSGSNGRGAYGGVATPAPCGGTL